MKVISIANQKGGVGKTTTAVNLSTALAATRKRVLLIDLDPQGNASTGLGIVAREKKRGVYDVLSSSYDLMRATIETKIPGLYILPSSSDLAGMEMELYERQSREYILRESLRKYHANFDYVLIDCPPALNLLTVNALCASDTVIIPLQCEFYALEGLSQLVKTVKRIKKSLNPSLDLQGIVLTMYDKRSVLSDQVAEDVRSFFGDLVFLTMIPRNVKISEAPSHGQPVLIYDVKSAGSLAYMKLAGEILKKEGGGYGGRI